MQASLLRHTSIDGIGFLGIRKEVILVSMWARSYGLTRRSSRRDPPPAAAAAAIKGQQDHYAVLGLFSHASAADIKRAYRLLARKYHPDVNKDLKADEVFKSIRVAYEVLSNETTRAHYDGVLRFQENMSNPWSRNWAHDPEFDETIRVDRWNELRQRVRHEKHEQQYNTSEERFSSNDESEMYEEIVTDERGPFIEVLRFAFFTLFFMQTLGIRISLAICGLSALLDKRLDAGYKLGFFIAWVLGGQGGILLSLCLSFASWLCGKTSSSLVTLVVLAMWVATNLARFAPFPPGAVLTLLYMSIKLQVELS